MSSQVLTYTGNLQSERDINAVRIKDVLHIFTGTYPLYYKGDGKLYMYPQYRPNIKQILRSGHNMLMDNFDARYRFTDTEDDLKVEENTFDTSKSFEITGFDSIPRIPYEGGEIKMKLSYNFPFFQPSLTNSFLPLGTYRGRFNSIEGLLDTENQTFFNIDDVVYLNAPFRFPDGSEARGFRRVSQGSETSFTMLKNTNKVNEFFKDGQEIQDIKLSIDGVTYFEKVDGSITENLGTILTENDGNVILTFQNNDFRFSITKGFIYYTRFYSFEESEDFSLKVTFPGSVLEWENPPTELVEVFARVYERPAGGTAAEWEEIEVYDSSLYSNKDSSFKNSLRGFVGDNLVLTPDGDLTKVTPLEITIPSLQSIGVNRDIKVELVRRRRGFRQLVGADGVTEVNFDDRETVASKIIYDFPVLPEKISNYPNEENPERTFSLHAPWSCNKVLQYHGLLMAYGSTKMPETLFTSTPEDISLFYFPHLFTKKFLTDERDPLESVVPFSNILVAQTANRTWGIKGTSPLVWLDEDAKVENPDAFRKFDINTGVGTIAYKTVRPIRNNLVFLSTQGVVSLVSLFATDDKYNIKLIDRNINNVIPQDPNAVAIQHDNQYWISFPETGEIYRYYIDNEAWMRDTFRNFDEFNGWMYMNSSDGKLRFVTYPMILNEDDDYEIYEGVVDKSLPTDFGENIVSRFVTADLDQGQPFHTKRYRELKFSFALQNQFLPPLEPIENISSLNGDELSFNFKPTKNHKYQIEFDFEVEGYSEEETEHSISEISICRETCSGECECDLNYEFKDNTLFIDNDLSESKIEVTVTFDTSLESSDVIITDVTYDFNIKGFVVADSDGNTINRIRFEEYETAPEQWSNSLGSRFGSFELGETPLGDVKRNIQTVRLSGTGYQIALAVQDESRAKWTLETVGIAYRMRKTRSR